MIKDDKAKKDFVVFSKLIMIALKEMYGINFIKIGINKKNSEKLVYFYEDTQHLRDVVKDLSTKLK